MSLPESAKRDAWATQICDRCSSSPRHSPLTRIDQTQQFASNNKVGNNPRKKI